MSQFISNTYTPDIKTKLVWGFPERNGNQLTPERTLRLFPRRTLFVSHYSFSC